MPSYKGCAVSFLCRHSFYEPHFFMVQDIVDYSDGCQMDMTIGGIMMEYQGGKRISITGLKRRTKENEEIKVDWVTLLTDFTCAKTQYPAYGNEAQLACVSPSHRRVKYVLVFPNIRVNSRCMVMSAFWCILVQPKTGHNL